MLHYKHLFILKDKFVYTRLQGLIWAGDGLQFNSKVNINAGNILLRIIENEKTDLPLIVNCKRVTCFDESVYRIIKESNVERKIIFIHIEESFFSPFVSELTTMLGGLSQTLPKVHLIATNHTSLNYSLQEYKNFIESGDETEKEQLTSIVKKSFVYFDCVDHKILKQLPSTAFFSTGEFDASVIISSPEYFHWVALNLSDLVEQFVKQINDEKADEYGCRLISVSLRASPFAAAVSLLTPELKFDTVDHLGPKHKLFDIDFFEKLKTNVKEKVRYIYLGDFLIGGTELKIAQTYVQIYGFDLRHAAVIGSYFEDSRFSNDFEIKSLIKLQDLKIPDLNIKLSS